MYLAALFKTKVQNEHRYRLERGQVHRDPCCITSSQKNVEVWEHVSLSFVAVKE